MPKAVYNPEMVASLLKSQGEAPEVTFFNIADVLAWFEREREHPAAIATDATPKMTRAE